MFDQFRDFGHSNQFRTSIALVNAIVEAEAYKSAGATKISAIATHGVFPSDALQRIVEHPILEYVSTTNSHPNVKMANAEKQNILCLSSIFIPLFQS